MARDPSTATTTSGTFIAEFRILQPRRTRHPHWLAACDDTSCRYDSQRGILLSTNKAFAEWSEVFPRAACVVTLVDRLIHRAEVIDIEAAEIR